MDIMERWGEISAIAEYSEVEKATRHRIGEEALSLALAEAETSCAHLVGYSLKKELSNLGEKISNAYRNIYSKSKDPDLHARTAMRWLWVTQRRWHLTWLGWMAGGLIYDNEITRELARDIYVCHNGDAGAAITSCINLDRMERKKTDFTENILDGLAMNWFCMADDLFEAGKTIEALDYIADAYNVLGSADLIGMRMDNIEDKSDIGKNAADVRHSKPGGSREKREIIRAIWASGKYSSRDICAEQECDALNLSFSTARKALRNTPDHTPSLSLSEESIG